MPLRPAPNVLWNLFLALIPVGLAFLIAYGARREKRRTGTIHWGLWLPLGLVWLVFLPNSCYLLTEWRHYLETLTQSALFQQAHTQHDQRLDFFIVTGFYLFYSGAGLLAFFLALWPLDRLTRTRLGWAGAVLRPLIFPLCALGVYLGLMSGRFNSWDLVHADRLHELLTVAAQVVHRPFLLGLILIFGGALWLFYAVFDLCMDGLAWRMSRRHSAPDNPAIDDELKSKKEISHASA